MASSPAPLASPPAPTRLVLASASPARLRLMTGAGLRPEVMISGIDEDQVTARDTATLVAALAARKAQAVAARPEATGALVIGCDSLLDVDGEAQGKPADPAAATARWRRLRGRSATLLTGHHLIDTSSGRASHGVAGTVVRFGRPSDDEISAYVATGEPLAVAGSFTLDGRGGAFIDGIDGDPNNVIGLSLALLRRLLADLGVEITSLWR
jgi:septum formation protein